MLKKSHVFPHPSLCHVWRTTWQKQCKHVYFSSSTPPQFCWSLCPHTAHNENGLCGLLWLLNNKTPSCIFPLMAMVSFWNLWKHPTKCSNLVPSLPPRVVPVQLCHSLKHWATTGICAHSHFSFLHCQKQYASWKELHRCLLNPIWGYTGWHQILKS